MDYFMYLYLIDLDQRTRRIERLLKSFVDQQDDRAKAKALTAVVEEKAAALGAAVASATP